MGLGELTHQLRGLDAARRMELCIQQRDDRDGSDSGSERGLRDRSVSEALNDTIRARELLVRSCDFVGFPGPRKDAGLTEWYSGCFDGMLLRGTNSWAEAVGLVADAMHAALLGNESATRVALMIAKNFVLKESAKRCACGNKKHVVLQHSHLWCSNCHLRRAGVVK